MPFPRTYEAIANKVLQEVMQTKNARAIVRKGSQVPREAITAATGGEWFWAVLSTMDPISGNGVAFKLPFNRLVYLGGLPYDLPNAQFVVQTAGVYRFGAAAYIVTAGHTLKAQFHLNLLVYHPPPDDFSDGNVLDINQYDYALSGNVEQTLLNGTVLRYLKAGDVVHVELRPISADTTAGQVQTSANLSWFQGELVRPGGEPTTVQGELQ